MYCHINDVSRMVTTQFFMKRIVKCSLFCLRCQTVLFTKYDDSLQRPCSIITANNLAFHHAMKRMKTTHLTSSSNGDDFTPTDSLDNIPKLEPNMSPAELSDFYKQAREDLFKNQNVQQFLESVDSESELKSKLSTVGIVYEKVLPLWLNAKILEQNFPTENLNEDYLMTINSNKINLRKFIETIQFVIKKAEIDNNCDKVIYGNLCELNGSAKRSLTILEEKDDVSFDTL